MNTITSESELRQAIALLEIKHAAEQAALKEQLQTAYAGLTPANIIKSTMEEISMSPDLKTELIQSSASLAVGFVSRKVIQKLSQDHPKDKELGGEVLAGAINFVAQNPELIRTAGNVFFALLRKARSK